MSKFIVMAGKHECNFPFDENIKFSADFDTLDAALDALSMVNDYPWSRIEYNGWKIEAYKR